MTGLCYGGEIWKEPLGFMIEKYLFENESRANQF